MEKINTGATKAQRHEEIQFNHCENLGLCAFGDTDCAPVAKKGRRPGFLSKKGRRPATNSIYNLIFLLFFFTFFLSCKENKTKNKHALFVKVYENALQMGDVNVAINACYSIIANDSTQTNYYDTLVYLYLNTSNQGSTYLAARRCLKYHPEDAKMNKLAANYAKALGMPDTAIMYYNKTFVLDNKLENLYDVAQIQYNMGNDAGAETTADIIINSPNSEKEKILIAIDKETTQEVTAKAAALNIKGIVFIQLGQKEIALRYFNESIMASPEFKLPKQNRDDIISGKIKFVK